MTGPEFAAWATSMTLSGIAGGVASLVGAATLIGWMRWKHRKDDL